ncbi:40s ribosomal protein s4 [Quercus suber]|uniref:40s ribosomal protein s4 n=1 Tax=Quercus suber TaxID=58331 RepID=A0AAW0L9P0_QUESU
MASHLTLFAASPAKEFAANPSPKKLLNHPRYPIKPCLMGKRGCVGVIKKGEKHKGSFGATHIQDAAGNVFETHQSNVFTIVEGTEPWVSLAKDNTVTKINGTVRKGHLVWIEQLF